MTREAIAVHLTRRGGWIIVKVVSPSHLLLPARALLTTAIISSCVRVRDRTLRSRISLSPRGPGGGGIHGRAAPGLRRSSSLAGANAWPSSCLCRRSRHCLCLVAIIALDDSSPGPPAFYAAALISRGGGAADEMVEDGRMMGGGHE